MSFNFSELQQKADKVLHNSDEAIRKWIDFISAPSGNVTLEYYDKNGSLQTAVFSNRNKLVQDFISSANSAMSKTFYVDAVTGDDGNDGSSSAPFKSVKKAIDSVPTGGYGTIYLHGSTDANSPLEYVINEDIYLQNKYIDIRTNGTYSVIKPKVEEYNSSNMSRMIILENSYLVLHNDDWNSYITIKNPQKFNPSVGWLSWRQYTIEVRYGGVYFRSHGANQTPMIRLYDSGAYLIGSQLADYATFINVGMWNYSIQTENTNAKLLHIGFGGGVCSFRTNLNGEYKDFLGNPLTLNWTNLISGIVRDANGVPRNIISNIIL